MKDNSKGILLIGNYPPPFGGVPKHIEDLAPSLVSHGWGVHILSGGSSGTECVNGFTVYKPTKTEKLASVAGALLRLKMRGAVRFRSVLMSHPDCWKRFVTFAAIGSQIIERQNIRLISAYGLYSGGPVGAVLSQRYGIPLVVTNFGEIHSLRDLFVKNPQLIPYICERSSKLLAISRHCADTYKALGYSPSVEIIPYGVDLDTFSPARDGTRIRRQFGVQNDGKIVLFVGRLIEEMGLHTVMAAIPAVLEKDSRAHFVLVGKSGSLLPAALELSKRYAGRVFVAPDLPLAELPYYYAASAMALAPTQGDRACSSLAAMEAMGTGRPVIATNVGGVPEVVVHGVTGLLIPPEDAPALSGAILGLLGDANMSQSFGEQGRKRAEECFDRNTTNRRLDKVFSEVAGLS